MNYISTSVLSLLLYIGQCVIFTSTDCWIYTVPNDAQLPHSNCSLKLTNAMKDKY